MINNFMRISVVVEEKRKEREGKMLLKFCGWNQMKKRK